MFFNSILECPLYLRMGMFPSIPNRSSLASRVTSSMFSHFGRETAVANPKISCPMSNKLFFREKLPSFTFFLALFLCHGIDVFKFASKIRKKSITAKFMHAICHHPSIFSFSATHVTPFFFIPDGNIPKQMQRGRNMVHRQNGNIKKDMIR